jgi:hypothetical protein
MILDRPLPFLEALDFLRGKDLLPTTLSADEMNAIDRQIREMSFWSAKVTDAGFLREALDLVDAVVNPPQVSGSGPGTGINPPRFRELMRSYLSSIGYSPDPDQQGTIQDLSTDARLNLIVETNTQIAQGFGQAAQRNGAVALDAFPADELVRIANFGAVSRGTSRDWPATWRGAGGRFYGGGRMIAPRDSEIWTRISHFGNPYPPFHYNSGMWTRPVSRTEAEQLGVIARGAKVKPMDLDLAKGLQAGVKDFPEALQAALAAALPGATIKDGVLTREAG